MIEFVEHPEWGYRGRTIENASADATIAFIIVNSPGEILTKKAVEQHNKIYIPFHPEDLFDQDMYFWTVDQITNELNEGRVKTLNIAGNGLYTLKEHDWNQEQADSEVYILLSEIMEGLKEPLTLIRSGGQTGFDEAGIKAAVKLEIPALCLAPKGWMFRDENGNDIKDEKRFKARFSF